MGSDPTTIIHKRSNKVTRKSSACTNSLQINLMYEFSVKRENFIKPLYKSTAGPHLK